eukprot:RCo004144
MSESSGVHAMTAVPPPEEEAGGGVGGDKEAQRVQLCCCEEAAERAQLDAQYEDWLCFVGVQYSEALARQEMTCLESSEWAAIASQDSLFLHILELFSEECTQRDTYARQCSTALEKLCTHFDAFCNVLLAQCNDLAEVERIVRAAQESGLSCSYQVLLEEGAQALAIAALQFKRDRAELLDGERQGREALVSEEAVERSLLGFRDFLTAETTARKNLADEEAQARVQTL